MCRYGFENCNHAECQCPPRLTDTHGSPCEFTNEPLINQLEQNWEINVDGTELLQKGDPRWKHFKES